ncbi:45439_t:CDS:2 [Gigaspora margarita]|uniref:45439_t:CDS:1 n=1 Tax=Gigaspora margarita TaxID=4874 RepID=A0ABN7VHE7_GIGMA|nr:45439_t:CDS:2 [Gigaspora margarita]
MAKVFELYYIPKILVEDGEESSSSEGKNIKQEERELGFETVLGNFIDAYLEVFKNWIPEINIIKEIQVKKDEHKVLKDCERLTKIETEMDKQIRVKDKIGIEQDEEPNTANDLERAFSLDAETSEKDNDQLTRSMQDLKSGPQELKVMNSLQIEEKSYHYWQNEELAQKCQCGPSNDERAAVKMTKITPNDEIQDTKHLNT